MCCVYFSLFPQLFAVHFVSIMKLSLLLIKVIQKVTFGFFSLVMLYKFVSLYLISVYYVQFRLYIVFYVLRALANFEKLFII